MNKLDTKNLMNILEYILKDETSKLKKLLVRIKSYKFESINYEKIIEALKLFKDDYVINEYLN
ncbi:hypothetical protein ACO3TA_00055 [Methanocaldococcus sp. 28A]